MSVIDLKRNYLQKIGSHHTKVEELRLFCLGKELKDDLFLYSYEIKDEMVI